MLFPNRPSHRSWKPTALVIDKDADTHRSIHVMLGKEYDVHHAYFPRLAISLLEKTRFNVVFTSLDMTSADETHDIHRTIQSISKDKGIPLIALADCRTGSTDADRCSSKSLEGERLLAALRTALAAATNVSEDEKE